MTNPAVDPARRRSRLRPAWRLFASVVVIPALLLLVGEICVRVFVPVLPPRSSAHPDVKVMRRAAEGEAPGVGWVMRPGAVVRQLYPETGPDGELRDRIVEYRLNEHGFRGPSTTVAKPAGTLRVCALGDSFTFGTGVAFEDTWPEVLRRELADRLADTRVEVLNVAMESVHTSQEVALLENRVLPFEPDVVVLCVHANDASGEGILREDRSEGAGARWIQRLGLTSGIVPEGQERSPAQRRAMAVRRRSRLADLVAHRLYYALYGSVLVENYEADWQPGNPGRVAFEEALRRARGLSDERGFTLVVAHYPVLAGLDDRYPLAAVRDAIAQASAAEGLAFVDLLPALAGEDGKQLWSHPHDFHPGPRANALVGSALSDALLPLLPSPDR